MANLAFNRNGMLSKPKPMQPGLSPPIMGQKPMQPGPTIGGLGGSANDLAPAGVATRPPMMGTDRIPGKPMLGGPTMGGRPPEDFGGMGGGMQKPDPFAGFDLKPPGNYPVDPGFGNITIGGGPPGGGTWGATPGGFRPDRGAQLGGGMFNSLLPTDPNNPPGGGQQRQALQRLFGGGMPSGGGLTGSFGGQLQPTPIQNGGFGGAPGGGGISAPAPPMGGGMTATMDPRLMRRRFDPGLR